MLRRPEPEELMDEPAQAEAYARADFSEPNAAFVAHFEAEFPGFAGATIADLGCGPGDIALRLARRYPAARVTGIDGAAAMLAQARDALAREPALAVRVRFEQALLPLESPRRHDAVVSNSLLHHLADPAALWHTARRCGRPGAALLVMDLARPESEAAARQIVDTHAAGEPEILRRDFHLSLLAAYEPAEVEVQLAAAGLAGIRVRMVSDRHWLAAGRLPS